MKILLISLMILTASLAVADWQDGYYDNLPDNKHDIRGCEEPHYYCGDDFIPYQYELIFTKITVYLGYPSSTPDEYAITLDIIRDLDGDNQRILHETITNPTLTYEMDGHLFWIFSYVYELNLQSGPGEFLVAVNASEGLAVLVYDQYDEVAIEGGYNGVWRPIDGVSDMAMRVDYSMNYTGIESTSVGTIKSSFK